MVSKTRLLIAFIWMDKIKILAVNFSHLILGKPWITFAQQKLSQHGYTLWDYKKN